MNKILLNICLILVTCALLYTILTLPATINYTVRTEAEAFMSSLSGEISQSVDEKATQLTQDVGQALKEEAQKKFDEVFPETLDKDELARLIKEAVDDMLDKSGVAINEETLTNVIIQVLRESLIQQG